jgi:uncharacterized protein (TIGR03790 family)
MTNPSPDRRSWWRIGRDSSGIRMPLVNRIQVLVTMRGVPLRINPSPKPATPPGTRPQQTAQNPVAERDEASVDSELAMIGIGNLPASGAIQNKFYKSPKGIAAAKMPFLILTARIDAASHATCQRMIRDALDTEKNGLWGITYVDIANKYPQGDQWLESIATRTRQAGIPTVVDRFNETLPKNYPMLNAAAYFGWYAGNANGPFLNPRFRFRKGAVAAHLHSFSAQQLASTRLNWCAALLERGAAATLGNVFEPYLHMSHDFGLLHQALLDGRSWVEACWMAMPVASWQAVVLGDPLYRPYLHLSGTGAVTREDREFRALRAAVLQWPDSHAERRNQLDRAAARMNSGTIAEAVGLELLAEGLTAEAVARFRTAKTTYIRTEDKMRQDLHIAAIDRAANRRELALRVLRDARASYGPVPEAEALGAWINILDPPPPPPPPAGKKTGKS